MTAKPGEALAARIIDKAQALTGETPVDEEERAKDIKDKLEEEKSRHEDLAGQVDDVTLQAARFKGKKPTNWHSDEQPNIPGLPEDVKVYYKVTPPDASNYGSFSAIRVCLEVEGEKPDEGVLAYSQYKDERMPVISKVEDTEDRLDSGVIQALPDGSLPSRLLAIDSASQDFAIVERAVTVVAQGETDLQENQPPIKITIAS